MTVDPRVCPEWLRRARLLAHLAPYIEQRSSGTPERVFELLCLGSAELAETVAPQVAAQLIAQIDALPGERLQAELVAAECWGCCKHDPRYPAGLRDADGAPWALVGRGDPALLGRLAPEHSVTIVGARRASTYGREVARELGRHLAEAGLLIISGLFFGIDACAHRGAAEAGRTVAVLGCGPDIAYPAAHRSLQQRITDGGGLMLSELPPSCGAWRWTFPARSRIMAALSGMTIVVEAAEHSGSLITADIAAGLGRDVGAVPGPVNSRVSVGPNDLLAGGACLIRGAQDVLDAMLGSGVRQPESTGPQLNSTQREVLRALEDGARGEEEIASDAGISESEVEEVLQALERLGYTAASQMTTYSATGLQPPPES